MMQPKGLTCFLVIYSSFLFCQSHPILDFETVYSGFNQPIDITNAGDGTNRLFVVERQGRIKIIENGFTLNENFLDIVSKVSTSGERGLLGLTFHPEYLANGFFYIHYSNLQRHTQIARYERDSLDSNKANPDSGTPIILINQPSNNHNGGTLKFGVDGYLYIALGDGGGQNDSNNLSQNGQELLGKMLRIDVDNGLPFSIPSDNPYIDSVNIKNEIWAIGLRNPFRFSFDRLTGDLWIADVGQNAWEEVSFQAANSPGGENYGWRCYEGNHEFNISGCQEESSYTMPIYEKPHPQGSSITGGFVYRGSNPCLYGVYIGADFNKNTVHTISPDGNGGWGSSTSKKSVRNIAGFGEDEFGELYAVSLTQGLVYKIEGETITLDQKPIGAGDYFSFGKIVSSGSIEEGDSLNFVASKSIEMTNPFQINNGGILRTRIGCSH